jgi:hypothetical protein
MGQVEGCEHYTDERVPVPMSSLPAGSSASLVKSVMKRI